MKGKYCIDVLNQIKAAKAALVKIESNVLKKHVESCVKESFKNKKALDSKVEELLKLINKMIDHTDKNIEPIDKKKKHKEHTEKIIKEILKPSCDEEISEEEYPTIKE